MTWDDALRIAQPDWLSFFNGQSGDDAVEWLVDGDATSPTQLTLAHFVEEHVLVDPDTNATISTEAAAIHVEDRVLVECGLETAGAELDFTNDHVRVTLKSGEVRTYGVADRQRDGQGISVFLLTGAAP